MIQRHSASANCLGCNETYPRPKEEADFSHLYCDKCNVSSNQFFRELYRSKATGLRNNDNTARRLKARRREALQNKICSPINKIAQRAASELW